MSHCPRAGAARIARCAGHSVSALAVFLLLAAVAMRGEATPSSGCGRSLPSGSYRFNDQGVERVHRLLVPKRYRPGTPMPLVLVFHGWGGDENEFLDDSNVSALADERGYILVAPRGLGSGSPDERRNSWSFRGSITGNSREGATCSTERTPDFTYPSCRNVARTSCSWTQCQADDVSYTLALVQQLESSLCIDTGRIFAVGGSNGGMFVWELGQNPATAATFRAVASLIGLPHRGFVDPPARHDGLPVLLITGTADKTVPPGPWESVAPTTTRDGSAYYYASATSMMRRWGTPNGCPYQGRAATPFKAGATPATCRTYCGRDPDGWTQAGPRAQWPHALDCRAPMGHEYGLDWSWALVLDFFDAQSQGVRTEGRL